ncbi:succinate--CoA ligase subunit alpha [Desulfosporosinus fructosivorans]|uniref:Succinate--CoA ligase subunit alpha n=1 Tax=Desulfosporosinus fructosivorans TaxID=2018669 RepID=A0A4Z0R8L8_9FIRM|nr:succinate--CoA ligase subunit alpha [Desulfosporosinus fructosivorans]TGE39178.1 succinate--CoA ligase subunit alpha [Desulfosporosinus fructosivorans]
MSIILDSSTKVLIQGITGKEGSYWAKHMKDYGTNVVVGVTPGKEGQEVDGVPVYHTVRRAVEKHQADASLLFVPPRFAKGAIFEALDAGIKIIVVTAEGIPLHEMIQIRKAALSMGAMVIGGNTTGIISTGKAMMGFFPYWLERVYKPGRIGVMTRSGSLTNEVTAEIVKAGFGSSSVIGVGGDPVPFTRFAEILPFFEKDPDTDAVVMIGEIGGTMEEEVAETIENGIYTKPLIGFMGGRTAPKGQKMGHAGAIITAGKGTVADKVEALINAGALVADRPSMIGTLLKQTLWS